MERERVLIGEKERERQRNRSTRVSRRGKLEWFDVYSEHQGESSEFVEEFFTRILVRSTRRAPETVRTESLINRLWRSMSASAKENRKPGEQSVIEEE